MTEIATKHAVRVYEREESKLVEEYKDERIKMCKEKWIKVF
jgi:hypothetical protein